jgi:hypothetical protein
VHADERDEMVEILTQVQSLHELGTTVEQFPRKFLFYFLSIYTKLS